MSTNDAAGSTRPAAGPERPIRVGILDEHVLLLDSMESWIADNAPEFEVVVRAETWVDLVRSENFPTALVLMDDAPAETVPLEARIRTCRAAGARVVVMSAHDPEGARARALAAGALAYLSKSDSIQTFHAVAREAMGLDGAGAPVESGDAVASVDTSDFVRPKLSPGELEALRLYATGNTTAAVARLMNVKYETAKTYLRRVREKYAKANRPASRRAELITRAAEDGYL
ncbi:helix-turn-helix transcriptional regulator [Microterricola viridarii]|uniref:Two-component system response regulator n=1 Tax=Microterricola viridarii TaxID=412690 RepID=A0A109QX65_9MICO|nr:LuxR C-terminal-related transcriptional regulator [Microterricola viridarii]AMB59402.1 two-component system response regulator [Microterricola viridarii]